MINSILDLFPPVRAEVHRFFEVADRHPFEPRHSTASGFSPVNAWDFIIVAFRGTQVFLPGVHPPSTISGVLADAVTDVQAGLIEIPPATGRVHSGFLQAADEVFKPQDILAPILDAVRRDGRERALWVTGHSLGGALAILTAARLRDRVQGVYVYGAPRVGDVDFGRTLNDRIVCFVHGRDPVADTPPLNAELPLLPRAIPPRFGRYHQLGRVVPFARVRLRGRMLFNMRQLGTRLLGLFDRFRPLPGINLIDHAPLLYVHHFRNLLR